jgi:hypothetical protein
MKVSNKERVKRATKDVDTKIAQKIEDVTNDICEKLEEKNVNIIETSDLIKEIREKNNFIQDMLKNDFAESEEILKRKMKDKKVKEKGSADWLASRILDKKINQALENMLEESKTSLEMSTILDRKLFLNHLLGTENEKNMMKDER